MIRLEFNIDEEEGNAITQIERQLILKALTMFKGHRTKMAQFMGISTRTLREKFRLHGFDTDKDAYIPHIQFTGRNRR